MLRTNRTGAVTALGIVMAGALVLSGCGGGGGTAGGGGGSSGGGGTSPQGIVLNVEGVTFTAPPPGGSPADPPPVFKDQAVNIEFDGVISAASLGGFYSATVGGPAQLFTGVSPSPSGTQYYAFANQTAARQAFQIFPNSAASTQLPTYVVGVHASNPKILVVDPVVPLANPFGLATSDGFPTNFVPPPLPGFPPFVYAQYVYVIPAGSALIVGGTTPPSTGPSIFNLPIAITPYNTTSQVPPGWAVQPAFGPDPIPPQVISIRSFSGAAGTALDPISPTETLVVEFSKRVSASSLDVLKNFRVRNLSVTAAGQPILVPGTLSPATADTNTPNPNDVLCGTGPTDNSIYCFTPTGGYGPGLSPTVGYSIEVAIGTFGSSSVPNILGVPQGTSQTQLGLANSLSATFVTMPCVLGPNCPPALATVAEGFDDSTKLDSSFVGIFGQARWNASSDPGKLSGRLLSGSPLGNNTAALGTRIQVIVNPTPLTTNPTGLYSPFDASAAATTACAALCGGPCNQGPTINPNGGSHVMHLFEAVDLGSNKDSIELIEWAPVGSLVTPTSYPLTSVWAGMSNIIAPISGACSPCGMSSGFPANYNLQPFQQNEPTISEDPYQGIGPGGLNPSPTTPDRIRVFGPATYVAQSSFNEWFPYPAINPPFDFVTNAGVGGPGNNLILEMNIETGAQCPNFHRYRATANVPVRRLRGRPLSAVLPGNIPIADGAGYDIYRMRYTFVGRRSSVRSLWYDTGTAAPIFSNMIVTPDPKNVLQGGTQPAGTQSIWRLDGKNGVSLPTPTTIPSTQDNVVYDANGNFLTSAMTALTNQGSRFFRFRVEILGNNLSNAVPSFNNTIIVYSF